MALHGTTMIGVNSEVQPDVLVYRRQADGGSVWVTADDYLEGAPVLILEAATSSAAYDLHDKLHVYERARVREYVVWEIYESRIIWFRLEDGRYVEIEPDEHGVIESATFPGLRLAVQKMIDGDDAEVLAELERRRPE